MTRSDILNLLKSHDHEMAARFSVKRLAIFGSASRDALSGTSDVDVLVEFSGPATFDNYFGLKHYLEQLLGREVDLATPEMIRPSLQERIDADLTYVA